MFLVRDLGTRSMCIEMLGYGGWVEVVFRNREAQRRIDRWSQLGEEKFRKASRESSGKTTTENGIVSKLDL